MHRSYLEHRSDRPDGNHEAIQNDSILTILLNQLRCERKRQFIYNRMLLSRDKQTFYKEARAK